MLSPWLVRGLENGVQLEKPVIEEFFRELSAQAPNESAIIQEDDVDLGFSSQLIYENSGQNDNSLY